MNKLIARIHSLGKGFNGKTQLPAAWHCVRYQSSNNGSHADSPSLLKHFTMKIKASGPITVAEYMRQVLTNPIKGYYMHQDMLGEHGDFITSPEISQIFGELLGIWCLSEWLSAGRPKAFQLVELGPGKGTLTGDILRVFKQFNHLLNTTDISVHLVEVSPKLSQVQAVTLTGKNIKMVDEEISPTYMKGVTTSGLPIFWYHNVEDVPPAYTFYIAHEFFDALPIHKLQKTKEGWREVLIDIDPEIPDKLRFVLGSTSPLVAKNFVQDDEKRDHVEVCPSAAVITQKLAHQIDRHGGAALIADYGHFGDKTDTFRGFRDHQLHDVLLDPGMADLTADVDFNFLKRMIGNIAATLGPVTQREFLKNMGIDIRLKVLLEHAEDADTQQQLKLCYDMLMNPDKMGERFKFFSLFPHARLKDNERGPKHKLQPVAGFTELIFQ
ncbi:protein arginine methyltransferase NDUFAF7, mitochondrial [Pelobates fuscus]|uniref:protein arginine methyltransferase NDUFAF7, mitochondrial n=1 Tax=Pelobates fuscus TaxID=191477 RepID=UPI002FE4EEC8